MASISSLKKAELITIVERQAIEIADLKDALLHAQNAATDAKHHAASAQRLSPTREFFQWAHEQAAKVGKSVKIHPATFSITVGDEQRFFQPS